MFVDASAIIAILGGEADATSLAARLAQAPNVFVSPIAVYEAVTGLARKRACPIEDAEALVQAFLEETRAQTMQISATIAREAVSAFARFGRGRHKANLNMGDCFAYACARVYRLPLLFKGDDFPHTDITVA